MYVRATSTICVRDSDPLLVFSVSQMGHGSWS